MWSEWPAASPIEPCTEAFAAVPGAPLGLTAKAASRISITAQSRRNVAPPGAAELAVA